MTEFIPGPWEYVKTSNGHFVMAGRYCVASTGDRGTTKGEANGKLIAAAPEMYEALKNLIYTAEKLWDMVKPIKDTSAIKAVHPIIEQAKIALAKAEGKQKTGD